jgi:hypothetical protein
MWSGGIAALPSQELAQDLVLSHFVSDPTWWTGVAVLNPGDTQVSVTLRAYDGATQPPMDQQSYLVPAKGKIVDYVEVLLPATANKTGWILVQASSGKEVAAAVVFGDKVSTPNKIAAAPALLPSTTVNLANFRSDADWWTGITLVNPGLSTANVTMTARRPDGVLIQSDVQPVDGLGKTWGFVDELFALAGETGGWIEVASSAPVVGLEVLHADDDVGQAWGLAGIASQMSGTTVYYGHYDTSSSWWTLFALANCDGSTTASADLTAYGNDGRLAGATRETINPKGRLADRAGSLFGP